MHSVDTKSEIVKILHFKQFYKHYVFNEDGDGGRKKVLKNYIDVYVCIDMVCGDTNMANAGMNPKALQYLMGHANITMTLNYYAHATFDSAQAEFFRLAT